MEFKITRDPSYHGYDKPTSNDIRHWKYIKREYDLGKHKYIYTYENTDQKNVAYTKDPYKYRNRDTLTIGDRLKYGIQDSIGYDEKKAYNTMKNTYEMKKKYV